MYIYTYTAPLAFMNRSRMKVQFPEETSKFMSIFQEIPNFHSRCTDSPTLRDMLIDGSPLEQLPPLTYLTLAW